MINDKMHAQMINWKASGYFAYSAPPLDSQSYGLGELKKHPFLFWLNALHQAKQGDFSLVPQLLEFCYQAQHPIVDTLSSELIGDAGPTKCFEAIHETINETPYFETKLDLCSAMHSRGLLGDVLVLLKVFKSTYELEDAEIIPTYISDLLEKKPGKLSDHSCFSTCKAYEEAVLKKYYKIAESVGSEEILVLKGDVFSITKTAKIILQHMEEPYVQSKLRRKFESSTGINCSSFFSNSQFQPLNAAAMVEEFLDSDEPDKYEPSVRYFFGHRIPD